jgi:hypothetical protein
MSQGEILLYDVICLIDLLDLFVRDRRSPTPFKGAAGTLALPEVASKVHLWHF